MKTLIIAFSLFSFNSFSQNFSPAASSTAPTIGNQGAGTVLGSPSAIGGDNFSNQNNNTAYGQFPNGNGTTVPGSGVGVNPNETNTAPTSIPTDNTLMNTPSNNPIQAQEAFPNNNLNNSPNTGSGSGIGTGSGTGMGTMDNINSGTPYTNP